MQARTKETALRERKETIVQSKIDELDRKLAPLERRMQAMREQRDSLAETGSRLRISQARFEEQVTQLERAIEPLLNTRWWQFGRRAERKLLREQLASVKERLARTKTDLEKADKGLEKAEKKLGSSFGVKRWGIEERVGKIQNKRAAFARYLPAERRTRPATPPVTPAAAPATAPTQPRP